MTKCQVKGDWASAACCLPLAGAALMSNIGMTLLAVWQVVLGAIDPTMVSIGPMAYLIVGTMALVLAVFSLLSITWRHPFFSDKVIGFWAILLITLGVNFFVLWVWNAQRFVEGWRPATLDIIRLCVETAAYFLLMVSTWWQYNLLVSLQRVFFAEGSGWEYKSYKELRILKILLDSAGGGPVGFDVYKCSDLGLSL